MSDAFVWFHNDSRDASRTQTFYEMLLGWTPSEGPAGMSCLGREAGPFAEVREATDGIHGWVPYAEVEDVAAATERAVDLGGSILQQRTSGPAGDFTIVQDPGGASVALWQKA